MQAVFRVSGGTSTARCALPDSGAGFDCGALRRQVDPHELRQTLRLGLSHLLLQVRDQVVLPGLTEDHAVERDLAPDAGVALRVPAVRQRRDMALDLGGTRL